MPPLVDREQRIGLEVGFEKSGDEIVPGAVRPTGPTAGAHQCESSDDDKPTWPANHAASSGWGCCKARIVPVCFDGCKAPPSPGQSSSTRLCFRRPLPLHWRRCASFCTRDIESHTSRGGPEHGDCTSYAFWRSPVSSSPRRESGFTGIKLSPDGRRWRCSLPPWCSLSRSAGDHGTPCWCSSLHCGHMSRFIRW